MSEELYHAKKASIEAIKAYRELMKKETSEALISVGLAGKKVCITKNDWLSLSKHKNVQARHAGEVMRSDMNKFNGYIVTSADGSTASYPVAFCFKPADRVKARESEYSRPVYEAMMTIRFNDTIELKNVEEFIQDWILPYFKPVKEKGEK